MATTIPTKIPLDFILGDTVKFSIAESDYPAPTWVITYYFNSKKYKKSVIASASGSEHLVTLSAAESAKFSPGLYNYQAKAESGDEKYTVDTGRIEVWPDESGELLDALTVHENIIEKLDLSILDRVTDDFIEIWTEAGRKFVANDLDKLKGLRNYYINQIAAEKAKRERAAGRPDKSRTIKAQFKPI